MARIASNDTDYRRGLVLGLTMAEVLILLLFILLLAATAAMNRRDRTIAGLTANEAERSALIAAVRPVVDALQEHGHSPEQILQELLPKASAFQRLEKEAKRINPDAPPETTLRYGLRLTQKVETETRLAELLDRDLRLSHLEERARRIDPEAPPLQTLQAAVDQAQARAGALGGRTATGVLAAVRDSVLRLGQRLNAEFANDLARWSGDINPKTLSLSFNNSDLLFSPGQATLRPHFQRFMRDFFPRYLSRLQEFHDDIDEVRIEGHTSSDWTGANSPLDAYFRNMALSQERTREVLQFGLTQTALAPQVRDWAQGRITANGLSSSRIRARSDGAEDRDASRRVEFRVVLKLHEKMMQVLPGQ